MNKFAKVKKVKKDGNKNKDLGKKYVQHINMPEESRLSVKNVERKTKENFTALKTARFTYTVGD